MNSDCQAFRGALEAQLAGQPDIDGLVALGWHEHLLFCSSCRDLLEEEEALERLIASLPRVALPPELSERILARLRRADSREAALDRLLDLDGAIESPTVIAPSEGRTHGLADRVLAALAGARESSEMSEDPLDRLLDRLEAPKVPSNLTQGLLAGLESARSDSLANAGTPADLLDGLLDRIPEPLAPVGLAERILRRVERARHEALPQRITMGHWVTAAAAILCVGFLTWQGLRGPGLPTDPEEASRYALPSADDPSVGLPEDFFHQYELLTNLEQLRDPQLGADLVLVEAADETFQLTLSATDSERLDGGPDGGEGR